jgi:GT2 family glycosyltransferase
VGIAVVLLNYKGSADTLACVRSLLTGTQGFVRLYVADNASPDGSLLRLQQGLTALVDEIREADRRWGGVDADRSAVALATRSEAMTGAVAAAFVTLLDNQGNWGFAGGNNVAIRLALQDPAVTHVWLLNNDTEVRPDTIERLCDAVAARPEVDLWGTTVVYHSHPDKIQALGGGALRSRSGQTWHVGAFEPFDGTVSAVRARAAESQLDYVLGASMLASRRFIETVGLLEERYFLYYEELDWATRGRRAGFRLGYAPDAVVFHKEGASIGTDPSGGTPLSVLHLSRSRVIYSRLHLGAVRRATVLLSCLWQTTKLVLKRRWPQARAALRGTWQGMTVPLKSAP